MISVYYGEVAIGLGKDLRILFLTRNGKLRFDGIIYLFIYFLFVYFTYLFIYLFIYFI